MVFTLWIVIPYLCIQKKEQISNELKKKAEEEKIQSPTSPKSKLETVVHKATEFVGKFSGGGHELKTGEDEGMKILTVSVAVEEGEIVEDLIEKAVSAVLKKSAGSIHIQDILFINQLSKMRKKMKKEKGEGNEKKEQSEPKGGSVIKKPKNLRLYSIAKVKDQEDEKEEEEEEDVPWKMWAIPGDLSVTDLQEIDSLNQTYYLAFTTIYKRKLYGRTFAKKPGYVAKRDSLYSPIQDHSRPISPLSPRSPDSPPSPLSPLLCHPPQLSPPHSPFASPSFPIQPPPAQYRSSPKYSASPQPHHTPPHCSPPPPRFPNLLDPFLPRQSEDFPLQKEEEERKKDEDHDVRKEEEKEESEEAQDGGEKPDQQHIPNREPNQAPEFEGISFFYFHEKF